MTVVYYGGRRRILPQQISTYLISTDDKFIPASLPRS